MYILENQKCFLVLHVFVDDVLITGAFEKDIIKVKTYLHKPSLLKILVMLTIFLDCKLLDLWKALILINENILYTLRKMQA